MTAAGNATTHPPVRQRFDRMPLPQQAGILSNDEQFQIFAGARTIKSGVQLSTNAAAEFIRQYCGVKSRKHLPHDDDARRKFAILRTEFDAWRGRIAKPQ